MDSLIFAFCKTTVKSLGIVNVYQNEEKYSKRWWFNQTYKVIFLIIINFTYLLYLPTVHQLFSDSSQIVIGKMFIESNLNWARLVIPYLCLIFYGARIDNWIEQCIKLGITRQQLMRLLRWDAVFYLFLVILRIIYYSSAVDESSERSKQTFTALGYFITAFVVEFTNLSFTTALSLARLEVETVNEELKNLLRNCASRSNSIELQSNFRQLRRRWIQLTDLAEELNKIFATHLWFFMTYNLLEVIYSWNQIVALSEHCKDDKACWSDNFVILILWFLTYLMPDLKLTHACSEMTYQSKQTSYIVTDLELASSSRALIRDLQVFSHELHSTKVEVSAGGLFTIDRPLVTKRAGTFATFLLVLSQFQIEGDQTFYHGFS